MHIYIERIHVLIHMCRVLHNKTFSKTPTILLKGIKKFQWRNCKKVAPSDPSLLEFEHCKGFGITRSKKDLESSSLGMTSEKTTRVEETEKGQWQMQEKIFQTMKMAMNLTKGKWITDGPSLQEKVYILERWHRPILWAKFEWPLWARKIKERSVWTDKSRRHATKVQSLRQEAEKDRKCGRS